MFFSNILAYCEANGLSFRKFEAMCGLANGQVGKWSDEREAQVLPSLPSLQKIVDATGIPIEKWLNGKVV